MTSCLPGLGVGWVAGAECGLLISALQPTHAGLWSAALIGEDLNLTRACDISLEVATPTTLR